MTDVAALPTFRVPIAPNLDGLNSTQKIVSFATTISFTSPDLQPGDLIVTAPLEYEDCQVTDGLGPLSVEWGPNEKTWALFVSPEPAHAGITPRASSGDVTIQYHISLPAEQGGFLGPGSSFLLNPPLSGSSPCKQNLPSPKYRNIVSWDISNAVGARTVSIFCEGTEPREVIGDAETLRNAVYMVGAIQSYSPITESRSLSDEYGYYWFGTLPPNVEASKISTTRSRKR